MDSQKMELLKVKLEVTANIQNSSAPEDVEKALKTVMRAGEMLLVSGAEVSRVEDTMRRILLNFKFSDAQAFVIPGMMILAVETGQQASKTVIKRVSGSSYHLGKVSLINSLSRELASTEMTVDEFHNRLEDIDKVPPYDTKLVIAAAGIGSFAFTYIINANIHASFVALFVGMLVFAVTVFLRRNKVSKILVKMLAGLLSFVFAYVAIEFLSDQRFVLEMVVFGSIIPHLPGMALVSSMRDVMGGDLVSGSIGLVDTLAMTGALATGVFVGYSFLM